MVSVTPIMERKSRGHILKVQRPVYFVSEVLNESKKRYLPQIQKLLHTVLIKRKLINYFERHSVSIVSMAPLSEIVRNRDAFGHIVKWSHELNRLNIDFVFRTAI